jgi:hypothetical protein
MHHEVLPEHVAVGCLAFPTLLLLLAPHVAGNMFTMRFVPGSITPHKQHTNAQNAFHPFHGRLRDGFIDAAVYSPAYFWALFIIIRVMCICFIHKSNTSHSHRIIHEFETNPC